MFAGKPDPRLRPGKTEKEVGSSAKDDQDTPFRRDMYALVGM